MRIDLDAVRVTLLDLGASVHLRHRVGYARDEIVNNEQRSRRLDAAEQVRRDLMRGRDLEENDVD